MSAEFDKESIGVPTETKDSPTESNGLHGGSLDTSNSTPRGIPDIAPKVSADFRLAVQQESDVVSSVLDRHPWAYPLVERLRVMPKDLGSSLRVGEITGRVVEDYATRHPEKNLTPELRDEIILGATLCDIGRADEDKEKMAEVYASGVHWRDDPNAWQWKYVQAHPGRSNQLVVEATGEADSPSAQIPLYHHALKRKQPYSSPDAPPYSELSEESKFGVEVAAAADVIDAITKNAAGEGRAYVNDGEFEGRTWKEVVMDELEVDPEIAELAVQHTLRIKGLLPQEDAPKETEV